MEISSSDASERNNVPHFPQPALLRQDRSAVPGPSGGVSQRRAIRAQRAQQLARGMGWLSIGLGMANLLAPQAVARTIGLGEDRSLFLRVIGVRELVCGAGVLGNEAPAGWLWTRVGGDLMDLSLLAYAAGSPGSQRGRLALTGLALAGVTALDVLAAEQNTIVRRRAGAGLRKVESVVTVNRPPDEVYQYWRNFENLPRFMFHLESVQVTGPRRSHWRARTPGGRIVEWDSELTIDQPGQMLAWRSVEGADVLNFGSVRFEPAAGGRGTTVHVEVSYSPPGGVIGTLIARLLGQDPATQISNDLRRFKQLLETGEIPTTEGQSSGRRGMLVRLLKKQAAGSEVRRAVS